MKRFSPAALLFLVLGIVAGYSTGRTHGDRIVYRETSTVALTHHLEKIGVYLGAIELAESGETDRVVSLLRDQLSTSVSNAFYLSENPIYESFMYPALIDAAGRAEQYFSGRDGSELLEERARVTHERLVALARD